MCSLWFGSASAAEISSRVNCPVRIGSSPLMPWAASPSAIAFTSSGCRLQSWAIWSNDSEVFSTSHTAVAFGVRGAVGIGKSPLRSARLLGEALNVIKDDWKGDRNIGGAAPRCNRPAFLGFLAPKVLWRLRHGRQASDRLFVAVLAADDPKQKE